jgi:hypothetical protein
VGFLGGDQSIIYNDFVSHADVGDTIWMVDDDEVYSEKLAQRLETWIRDQTYHAIWLPSIVFWHDFYHIRPDHGERPHQRIYMKLDESAHYIERNLDVRWNDDSGNIYGYGIPPKSSVYRGETYSVLVGDSSLAYHHYAYVRSVQRMLEKTVSQYIQNIEPMGGPEVEHCKRYRDPIEFKIETHSWFTNHDPEKIEKFSGSHPDLMKFRVFPRWIEQEWDEDRIPIDYEQAKALLFKFIELNTSNIVEEEL